MLYTDRYHIHVYLQDAVRMVLEARDDRPLHAIARYFQGVLQGNHVLLREYVFVNAVCMPHDLAPRAGVRGSTCLDRAGV